MPFGVRENNCTKQAVVDTMLHPPGLLLRAEGLISQMPGLLLTDNLQLTATRGTVLHRKEPLPPMSCSLHPMTSWCRDLKIWPPHLSSERVSHLQSFHGVCWALIWKASQLNYFLCPILPPSLPLEALILRVCPIKTPSMLISTSESAFWENQPASHRDAEPLPHSFIVKKLWY